MAKTRTSLLALALGGLLAPVSAQPEPPGVQALLKNAEAHLDHQRIDSALELLLRAAHSLCETENADERAAMRSTVEDMLRQADPLDDERRRVQGEAGDRLCKLARIYRRRGWYEVSMALLDEAEELSPGVGTKERDTVEGLIQKKSRKSGAKPENAATSAETSGQDVLENLEVLQRTRGWRRDPSGIQSPPIRQAQTVYLLAKSPRHADNRIRVELRIGPKAGKAALAFGVADENNYYLAELNQVEDTLSSLVLWKVTDDDMEWLEVAFFELTDERASDWAELTVDVRDREVTATIHGKAARMTCDAAPYGGVGLWISGNSENADPVHFRGLRVEDLPTGSENEQDAEPAPENVLRGEIAAAESMFVDERDETAILQLLQTHADLSTIEDDSAREALAGTIDGLLSEHDPEFKRSREIRSEIATLYLGLAEQYAGQDHPLAALAILGWAAENDRDIPRQRIAEIEASVAEAEAIAESEEEDAEFAAERAWLESFRQYFKSGWQWRDGSFASPELLDTHAACVTDEKHAFTGSAFVETQVSEYAGAGLVFGWRSKHDFFYVGIDRQGETSSAVVARWKNESWQFLYRELVETPLPDAWSELSVAFHDGAIEFQVGEIGPLMLENDHFDFRGKGHFGLVGWGTGRGGHATFRHLEIDE